MTNAARASENSRLEMVDALRGFALAGLFLVHMVESYELYWADPKPGWISDTVFLLLMGKSFALLALCFVLAWLTKRFVEDPARGWKVLTSRPARVTLWSSLAAMVVVASVAGAAWAVNAPAYNAGVQALHHLDEHAWIR